jgi:hypothetical protein
MPTGYGPYNVWLLSTTEVLRVHFLSTWVRKQKHSHIFLSEPYGGLNLISRKTKANVGFALMDGNAVLYVAFK